MDLSVAPLRSLVAQLSRKWGYAPNEICNASIAAKEELLKHDVEERAPRTMGA